MGGMAGAPVSGWAEGKMTEPGINHKRHERAEQGDHLESNRHIMMRRVLVAGNRVSIQGRNEVRRRAHR